LLLTGAQRPSAHGGSAAVRMVCETSGPALFAFEALPTSSRGVAARMVCETRGLALVAPRRQRAPPHAGWLVWSDTLLPFIEHRLLITESNQSRAIRWRTVTTSPPAPG